MEKENSSMKNIKKKAPNKTSIQFNKNLKSSNARRLPANIKNKDKDFDEMDSLIFLNHANERKNLKGIDEKIMLLKMELKSLVNLKPHKNSDYISDKSNSVNKTSPPHLDSEGDLEGDIELGENSECLKTSKMDKNEFKPNFNSTPSKFSDWLDKTVDELDRRSKKFSINELNSVLQIDLTPETFQTVSFSPDLKSGSSNLPFLSEQKIEQLLYKSFLMQNSSICLWNLDLKKSTRKTKHRYDQRSKSGGKCKRRPVQRSSERLPRFGVGQIINNSSSSHSVVEIINLDCSSVTSKTPRSNIECVDLDFDISSIDWSEPFDLNENNDHSDVQILEDDWKKNDINYKLIPNNNSNLMESDLSACYNESGKLQSKKTWECPVCFERSKGQEIVATQCGHVFCRKCIERHISGLNNNCPSCRCDLRDKPFITLFNL